MAINYITINNMEQLASLAPNDKILVAREGGKSGYATYKCAMTTLSNAISCDVSDITRERLLISTLQDSPPAGADSKAPSYNVLLSVYNNQKYISAHYLNADAVSDRTISGNITFSGHAPKINDIGVTVSNAKRAVNCATLSSYIKNTVKTRSIGNDAPVSYIYKVVSKEADADTDDVYNNQTRSGQAIKRWVKNCRNGPIIHKCAQDCTVIVTAYSVGQKFALFGFYDSNAASMSKAEIKEKQETLNWHMLGRLGSYYNSSNSGIMSFQAKAGTWLCFYMNEKWNQTALKYLPNYTADYGANDTIRIDEYRS